MQVLAPTPRSFSSSASAQLLNLALLALLLSLSIASQPADQSTSKKILKRVLVKKSKSAGSSNLPPKRSLERSQMLELQDDLAESRDHHPNSIPDSYAAPTASPTPTNFRTPIQQTFCCLGDFLGPFCEQFLSFSASHACTLLFKSTFVAIFGRLFKSIESGPSSGYLPPSMTPFVEEEAMATMLMSMAAENLTPPSVHYDPSLMHGGGMGTMMMSAAQGLDSTKKN